MKRLIVILLFLAACTMTGKAAIDVSKEYTQPTEVYFCPHDYCRYVFAVNLLNSTEIKCALYDTDIPEVLHILKMKHARVVYDDQSSNLTQLRQMNSVIDSKYSQMHNKFCILDNQTVITGSMNPTIRDTLSNNNNLLIIHSKKLAEEYNTEFEELYSGTFSGGERTRNRVFYINNDRMELSFCPEDWCANEILYALEKAEYSIYFATFSFTHEKLGDMLIKKKNQGLIVRGVMEKTQNSQYSQFKRLNESGINVKWDKNKANMHNKVFIIDESVVVTGSFNPSLNGDTKNDENVLIIYSPELGKKYADEFNSVISS